MRQISACFGTNYPKTVILEQRFTVCSQTELMSWISFGIEKDCKMEEKRTERLIYFLRFQINPGVITF